MAETQRIPDQIALQLRREILVDFKVGDRLPTVIQLAQRFDVSKHSVTCALDILAREGLIEKWQGSGTYVKEQSDERPVGVVMGVDFAIPDISYFWRQLAQQIRLRLAAHGVRSRLYAGFWRPESGVNFPPCQELDDDIANNRLRAIAYTSGSAPPKWAGVLREWNVPVVGQTDDPNCEYSVSLDQVGMIREATERLIAAGRRKLAFITWTGPAGPGLRQGNPLFAAYADVLTGRGVPLDERWVRSDFSPHQLGGTWEEFREIWTGADEKPDGLVVADDVLFRGVAKAIGELGIRVPEQLLIVTQANRGAIEQYPFPLWRMVSDPDAVAQAQVDLLLALLRHEPVPQPKVVLPFQFVAPDAAAVVSIGTRETEEATKERV